MNKCPFCGSENIYFSKKRQVFVCEECDHSFTEECIKRAEFLNFNSCIESIQNLIDGKSEILKLYMV